MRRSVAVSLLVIAFLAVSVVPTYAWWHRPWGWGPPYPYWYYPRYYVVAPPPPVIVETPPPVYVQPEPPQGYWYYCPSAQAYYPNVQTCPEAWTQVPPRSQ